MKNTDLHVKFYFENSRLHYLRKLLLIMVRLFGAAYAVPNKSTTILY